ncbi:vWA domain-containing protein [Maribacter sp. CXY002]|uniref:vWA domain-containing protein n=1 Tax=Maribacter luteocoastalis TaxID=3407671 RepID=UPI003B671AB1
MKLSLKSITIGLLTIALYFFNSYELKANSKKETIITKRIPPLEKSKNNTVKIALLLDTSNSMDGLINQAKSQLWDIVNEFTNAECQNKIRPELQIAIYQYGNDHLSSREGYIQQVLNFSNDLDEISEKLFSLSTNGGEEYCGQVIQTSLNQLDWGKNPDNLKMIFIAGNEPFDQGHLNFKDAATNAKEKNVIVNTIYCGGYEEGIQTHWKEGARLTAGEYMAIDHNREVVQISTPYDDIIIKLNSKLNKTYISYGSLGITKMEMQITQDDNAMALEEVVAVKRAVSKSSRLYNNKHWDLVDASKEKDFDVSEIKPEALPKELKGKSKKEIESFITNKATERNEIQNEIQELNRKREAYIAKNKSEENNGELESAMLKAIKRQASAKNYIWK